MTRVESALEEVYRYTCTPQPGAPSGAAPKSAGDRYARTGVETPGRRRLGG